MRENNSEFLSERVSCKIVYPYENSTIIKETFTDGAVRYRQPTVGEVVKTETTSLYEMFERFLDNFQIVMDTMEDEDYARFGFLFQTLINDLKLRNHEIFDFIDEYIGTTFLHVVSRGDRYFRQGRVVGAEFKAAKKKSSLNQQAEAIQ